MKGFHYNTSLFILTSSRALWGCKRNHWGCFQLRPWRLTRLSLLTKPLKPPQLWIVIFSHNLVISQFPLLSIVFSWNFKLWYCFVLLCQESIKSFHQLGCILASPPPVQPIYFTFFFLFVDFFFGFLPFVFYHALKLPFVGFWDLISVFFHPLLCIQGAALWASDTGSVLLLCWRRPLKCPQPVIILTILWFLHSPLLVPYSIHLLFTSILPLNFQDV